VKLTVPWPWRMERASQWAYNVTMSPPGWRVTWVWQKLPIGPKPGNLTCYYLSPCALGREPGSLVPHLLAQGGKEGFRIANEAIGVTVVENAARPVVSGRVALLRSPLAVGGLVMLLYAVWFGAYAIAGYSAHDLILISKKYATQSHKSSAITYEPHRYRYTVNTTGYDGEFFYFIATDPVNARYYVDFPSYRYTKILYPMLARGLALGRVDLIPYTLLLINWLAVGAGTALVAAWLMRRRLSPWLALVYGLYPGIFIGFQRDLTEPLSYALVALAIYLFDYRTTRRILVASVVFALAGLTRDKSLVFPALYAASLFMAGGWNAAPRERFWVLLRNLPLSVVFSAVAVGPLALWKLFILYWMHSTTVTGEAGTVTPFGAIRLRDSMNASTVAGIPTVVLPGLICGGMALWALYRRERDVKIWVLLVVVVFSVVTLDPQFYRDLFSMLRVSAGVVLAAIYCLPIFDRLSARSRRWFWVCVAGWIPIPLVFSLFGPVYLYAHT
jgi:hypothetical protein